MKPGDYVTYIPKNERGIIKSLSKQDGYVFVVYKCNNDWKHYYNYTAASTRISDLEIGWVE